MTQEDKLIHHVVVFYVPLEKLNTDELRKVKWADKPADWEDLLYKRTRCWGWFSDKERAERCIKENWTDIYECGYYNLACIETSGEGICNIRSRQTKWFTAEYIDQHTYKVTEIECPLIFKSLTGFSLA